MTIQNLALEAVAALGIDKPDGFDGSFATFHLLSPNDRTRVTNYSTAYVRANPDLFTASQVNVANHAGPVQEQSNVGLSYSDFWTEVGNNANDLLVDPIVNVGNTASTVAKILPLVLIGLGILWLSRSGYLRSK